MNNKKLFRPILIIVVFTFLYQSLVWAYPCQSSCLRALSFLQRAKPADAGWDIVASASPAETKTKITYTVRFGENPSEQTIRALINNGVTRFWFDIGQVRTKTDAGLIIGRMNKIRRIAKESKTLVTIVADMGGRQIHVGITPKSNKVFELKKDQRVFVGINKNDLINIGLGQFILVDDLRLIKYAAIDNRIIINEGDIELKVVSERKKNDDKVECIVVKGGHIQEGLDVFAPDTNSMSPSCLTGEGSDKFFSWFVNKDEKGPDMIALAIQSEEDVRAVQEKLAALGRKDLPIIAELSTGPAIESKDKIRNAGVSAIVINRKTLYLINGPDEFSLAQNNLVTYAKNEGVPVIVKMDMGEHIVVGKSIPDWSESLEVITNLLVDSINFRLGTRLDEDPIPSMETLVRTIRSHEKVASMAMMRPVQTLEATKGSALPRDLVLKLGYVAACDRGTNVVCILTRSGRNRDDMLKMSAMGQPMAAKMCVVTPVTAPEGTINVSNFRRETVAILVVGEPADYGRFSGEYIPWLAKILPEKYGTKTEEGKIIGNAVMVYGPSARDSDTLTIIDLVTGREISAPIQIASNTHTANLPQRNTASSI